MKVIGHAALFAVALTLCALALAQETQPVKPAPAASEPAGTQPTSAPTGPKIKLLAALKPGEAWAVVARMDDESSFPRGGDQPPYTTKSKTTFNVVLTVNKGGEGEKNLQATFKRARQENENNGEKTSHDTDNPASDPQGRSMAGLIDTVMKMRLDDKNKIVVTDGLSKYLEGIHGLDDPAEKQKVTDMFNGIFSQLLLGGLDFLPPAGEAAVGETWQVKRESLGFAAGPDAKEKQRFTCKLDSVEPTKNGRIAVVEITGTGKITRQLGDQENEQAVTYTGHAKFNVDKQQIVSVKLEMNPNRGKDLQQKMISETTFTSADPKAATTAPASGPAATKPSQHE